MLHSALLPPSLPRWHAVQANMESTFSGVAVLVHSGRRAWQPRWEGLRYAVQQ